MSHLDEGTLHALLDGELNLAEVSEVQQHLGSCVACGSRLMEVKQILAEADQLVGAVEVPAAATRPRTEPPRQSPPPRIGREPDVWDEPPVLLVPDPIDPHARLKRWFRGLRWAAAIAVVVVGGKMLGNALSPSHPVLPERDLTSAAPSVAPAVVSREESRRPDSTLASRKASRPQTRAPAALATKPAPVKQEAATDTTDELADASAASDQDSNSTDSLALAAETTSDTVTESDLALGAVTDSEPTQSKDSASNKTTEADELATRRAAAAALAELDRERRRERAAAATAALPAPARPVQPSTDVALSPPTLEQRAQVYLRIGLDEAVKQLGGPVHVIEGMTPELIGLTRTQLIPGTNPPRPVVRVVYLDRRGRMILLDQQRMAAGQAPTTPSGSLRWAIGDVMLYLRGEPSPEVLRSLQGRVR